jgi:FtsH-binding integral membrane protein
MDFMIPYMVNFLKRWWLPALLISLPFERIPAFDLPFGSQAVTLRLSLALAGVGLVLYGPQLLRRASLDVKSPWFWLFLYWMASGISIIGSLAQGRSVVAFLATSITLTACVTVAHAVTSHDLSRLYKIIAFTAAGVSLIGIYQFYGDLWGLSNHLTGLREIYTKEVFGFPRIQSTSAYQAGSTTFF